MKIRYLIGLWTLLACNWTAHAQRDITLPACDLSFEQTLYWEAIGEEVTISISLMGETDSLPRARFDLTFQDGKTIHLGEGGKFIDDFSAESVPTCEDHLDAAKSPLISSLKTGAFLMETQFQTIADLNTSLNDPVFCEIKDPELVQDSSLQTQLTKYKTMQNWQSAFPKCGPVLRNIYFSDGVNEDDNLTIDTFNRLVQQNAPFLEVPYSTYGVDIYVLDTAAKQLLRMGYSGC